MGTGAQVGKFALFVEGDVRVLRKVVDQLYFEGLVFLLHEGQGLGSGQLEPLQLQLFLTNFPHFALDLLQDFGGEGEGGVHIIIKSLVNGGADGQLYLREEALDGLGQDMGAGVPISLAEFGVFKRVQIFFGHAGSSFVDSGQNKTLHP